MSNYEINNANSEQPQSDAPHYYAWQYSVTTQLLHDILLLQNHADAKNGLPKNASTFRAAISEGVLS